MINFSTLQGLSIPEGVVTRITDASGRVLWAVSGFTPIVLEVKKITSNTYVSSTSYSGEHFILLDIYPKTNCTVKITYGGLTKTITDTSGAEEPNAQQVFFGTFGGVTDSVETPESGTLTIEGDCDAFACGSFEKAKSSNSSCNCITAVTDYGTITQFPSYTFGAGLTPCEDITEIVVPENVVYIGSYAFSGCTNLERVIFENQDGWRYSYSSTSGQETVLRLGNGTSYPLNDPVHNAELLTKTWYSNPWYK